MPGCVLRITGPADAHELWTFQVAARAMNDGWRWKSRTVYCPSCWSERA